MGTAFVDPDRQTVPRWRPWRISVRLGLADGLPGPSLAPAVAPQDLDKLEQAWELNRTLPFAGDFLGAAVASGVPDRARAVATWVLQNDGASRAARDLSALVVHGEQQEPGEPPRLSDVNRPERVRDLRTRLKSWPRDPLSWLDLAREYAALGKLDKARRPVEIALALAPDHRLVLRSAARFFLHADEPDRAHWILRKSSATRSDPWLLAAEIAVADAIDHSPSFLKRARAVLEASAHPPKHLSELASAMGTLEMASGQAQRVKKLLRLALKEPTENAAAQVRWVQRRWGEMGLPQPDPDLNRAYEASSWRKLEIDDFDGALFEAGRWLRDEPFSSRPAEFGSWVGPVALGDFEAGLRFAKAGILTHPTDFLLLNNATVCLASLDRPAEARAMFAIINYPEAEKADAATLYATEGLVEFRSGDPILGRMHYERAVEEAKKQRNPKNVTWALLHFAREEFQYDHARAAVLLAAARDTLKALPPSLRAVTERVVTRVEAQAKDVSARTEIRPLGG